jgi:hypothetical protein
MKFDKTLVPLGQFTTRSAQGVVVVVGKTPMLTLKAFVTTV